jgi:SAM-dependent methyltransferase
MLEITSKPSLRGMWFTEVPASSWQTLSECPLCLSDADVCDLVVIEEGSIFAACTSCEHIFSRRRPSTNWLDHYYSAEWDRLGRNDSSLGHHSDEKVLNFCRSFLPEGARVLDSGAGFGSQILGFKNAGYNAHALERSEHRAEFIRETLRIPCVRESLENFADDQKFDLVFLHHVFEHVSNPREVMSHMTRLLQPNGMVYLAVPNQRSEYPPKSVHLIAHLHWFSLSSLKSIFAKCGYEILRTNETSRELQVLARYVGDRIPEWNAGEKSDFIERTMKNILRSFGAETKGHKTIISCKVKSANSEWEQRVVSGTIVTPLMLRAARMCLNWMPNKLASTMLKVVLPKILPKFYSTFLRSNQSVILTLRADESLSKPLHIRHRDKSSLVWAK